MTPRSRSSRSSQRDRLSINVIPDHLHDTEPHSPYLHWLFGDTSENDIFSRLVDDELDEENCGSGYRNADAAFMKEVAAWLNLREHDEFWISSRSNDSWDLPTISQVLALLKASDSELDYTPNDNEAFDAVVQAIALQLLASCYTYLPSSSASQTPLFQQRTSPRHITALRAHAPFRFAPAAGHHARAPSEETAWPGLYSGPGREEVMADAVSQRRRSAKGSIGGTPNLAASGWTDGGDDIHQHAHPSLVQQVKLRVLEKFGAQSPESRHTHRKRSVCLYESLSCSRQKGNSSSDKSLSKKTILRVRTFTVQRFPSQFRRRRTLSNLGFKDKANTEHDLSRPGLKLDQPYTSDTSIASKSNSVLKRPTLRHALSTSTPTGAQSTPCTTDVGPADGPPGRKWLSYTPTDRPSLQQPILPPPRTCLSLPNPLVCTTSCLATPATLAQTPDDYFRSAYMPGFVYDVGAHQTAEGKRPTHPVRSPSGDDDMARPVAIRELAPNMARKMNGSDESSSVGSALWDRRRRGIEAETDALEHGLRGFKPTVIESRDVGVWTQRHWGSSTFGNGVEGMRGNV